MARIRTRTLQQRDARELALTRPSDPYRGALSDPFTLAPAPAAAEPSPAPGTAGPQPAFSQPLSGNGVPGSATLAGILGILLGLALGLYGLLLVTVVSLQDQYGAPDRSYYRGTDSGYVILGLIDFGLAALCGVGAITLLTGRIIGRVALTAGGWACLMLAAYWLEVSTIVWYIPVITAAIAAIMLLAAYTRGVTRWLGVLPAPQPD